MLGFLQRGVWASKASHGGCNSAGAHSTLHVITPHPTPSARGWSRDSFLCGVRGLNFPKGKRRDLGLSYFLPFAIYTHLRLSSRVKLTRAEKYMFLRKREPSLTETETPFSSSPWTSPCLASWNGRLQSRCPPGLPSRPQPWTRPGPSASGRLCGPGRRPASVVGKQHRRL